MALLGMTMVFVALTCLVETGLRVETSQVEGGAGSSFKK